MRSIGRLIGIVLALVAILAVAVKMFAGSVIKLAVETEGSKHLGAQVNVTSASVTFFPVGVELFGVQATDPMNPLKNMVDAGRIAARVEIVPLLQQKVVISEAFFDDVRFGTDREHSGALPGRGVPAVPALSFALPNPATLIVQLDLETVRVIQSLRDELAVGKEQWATDIGRIIDTMQIELWRKRVDEIRASAASGAAKTVPALSDAQQLLREVQGEFRELDSMEKQFRSDLARWQQLANAAAKAPAADLNTLKTRFPFTIDGAVAAGEVLLGQEIRPWVERLAPFFTARAEQTPSESPWVVFVETLNVNASHNGGTFAITVRGITTESPMSRPVTLELNAEKFGILNALKGEGELSATQVGAKFRGSLAPQPLLEKLTASQPLVARTLQGALLSQPLVPVEAEVNGAWEHYTLRIRSGIDQVAGQALQHALYQQRKEWEGKLQNAILSATSGDLQALRQEFSEVQNLQKHFTERRAALKELEAQLVSIGKGGSRFNIKNLLR